MLPTSSTLAVRPIRGGVVQDTCMRVAFVVSHPLLGLKDPHIPLTLHLPIQETWPSNHIDRSGAEAEILHLTYRNVRNSVMYPFA
jgi:hypothetical protein